MPAGACLTHARKSIDPGMGITKRPLETRPLLEWLAGAPALRFMPARYTHACGVIARQERMVTINSVLEVDLLGQVNAERIAGRRVGGDRGARRVQPRRHGRSRGQWRFSPCARSIAAAPATGSCRASTSVTLARTDTDIVVTEYGVARLRGLEEGARARALIAIAHPDHRESLERAWREIEA